MSLLNKGQEETQPITDHASNCIENLTVHNDTVGSLVERMIVKDGDKSIS